jgi:hypothetical protein
MATKGLFVIKFTGREEPVYFSGYNTFSNQLRKAKIYVLKERAIEAAEALLKRTYYDRPIIEGAYEIVEVELREKKSKPLPPFEQLTLSAVDNIK